MTREKLREQTATIIGNHSEIAGLPEKVDEWHSVVIIALRTAGLTSGVYSIEKTVKTFEENRDNINTALKGVSNKLRKLEKGIDVPVTFVDYADEWRNVSGDIVEAKNKFDKTTMWNEWQGDASARYRQMREGQTPALTSLPKVCETIAVSLETVATDSLTLYTDISSKTRDLISAVTNLTNRSVASFFDFPWGPLSASADLVEAVQASETFVVNLTNSLATNSQSNMIEGNRIFQSVAAVDGMPQGKWPAGVDASYGSGIEGIRNAIGDASVTDGDKSDWNIRTTEVPL